MITHSMSDLAIRFSTPEIVDTLELDGGTCTARRRLRVVE